MHETVVCSFSTDKYRASEHRITRARESEWEGELCTAHLSQMNGKIKISILIYGHLRKNDVQMNLSILHAIQQPGDGI